MEILGYKISEFPIVRVIDGKEILEKELLQNRLKYFLKGYYDPSELPIQNNNFLKLTDELIKKSNYAQGFLFTNEKDLKYFIQAILLSYRREIAKRPNEFFPTGGDDSWLEIDSEELHKKRTNITQPALASSFLIINHAHTLTSYRTLTKTVDNCISKRTYSNKKTILCSLKNEKFCIPLCNLP